MESGNPNTLDAVELLFVRLGNPCTTLLYTTIDLYASDSEYHQALRAFMYQTEESNEEDHPDIPFLRGHISDVLRCFNEHGLRIAFIERLAPLLWGDEQPHWGSYQRHYLSLCRWIFQGRQVDKLSSDRTSVRNAPQPTPADHYRYLPKELTASQACAQCGKSSARLSCGRCLVLHGSHVTICTTYCDDKCRLRHWLTHKPTCDDRVRLIRSVAFMKAVFTTIMEELTMLTPWGCAERNGMTILEESFRTLDFLRGDPLLHKFPHDQLQTERHATMALQGEYAPYLRVNVMLLPLLLWLWSDMHHSVQEVPVLVKNVDRPLLKIGWTESGHFRSNVLRPHRVLQVSLLSGEVFAVDLAAGQFGWAESLMYWGHFVRHRVFDFTNFDPRGEMARYPLYDPNTAAGHFHKSLMVQIFDRCRGTGSEWLVVDDMHPFVKTELLDKVKEMTQAEASAIEGDAPEYLLARWKTRLERHGIKFREPQPSADDVVAGVSVFED
ncbi:hypothetical protein Hte_001936 [Hypoxylon texense]